MRQQVLKALANPSLLFGVPYTLAVLNFMVQFTVFIVLYVVGLTFFNADFVNKYFNPLYFLISVCLIHMLFARFTKNDSQIGQVLIAKIKMMKNKIPRRLSA
ncbi:MAG: VirB3 family type IV secretion system protein [Alphaproteobacteria bacterium]|nr:VirB3 family type IV secretion system protein [Alphaproteobacteria bacterium]